MNQKNRKVSYVHDFENLVLLMHQSGSSLVTERMLYIYQILFHFLLSRHKGRLHIPASLAVKSWSCDGAWPTNYKQNWFASTLSQTTCPFFPFITDLGGHALGMAASQDRGSLDPWITLRKKAPRLAAHTVSDYIYEQMLSIVAVTSRDVRVYLLMQ